jgi:hypothetical protein
MVFGPLLHGAARGDMGSDTDSRLFGITKSAWARTMTAA